MLKEKDIKVSNLPAAQRGRGKEKMEEAEKMTSSDKQDKEFQGVSQFQKVPDNLAATLRYGLDYQSLVKQGLSKE